MNLRGTIYKNYLKTINQFIFNNLFIKILKNIIKKVI